MKKTLFFLLIITTLWSCKRQSDITPSSTQKGGKLQTLSGGDGKWDVLGYGLDVTDDLLDITSVSDAPIFDMTRFANDYPSRINVITTTEGSENYYSGVTAYDYLKDVTKKTSFDLDANSNPKPGPAKIEGASPADDSQPFFSGSLSKNSSDENKTTYSNRYSYATFEEVQRVKKIAFTGDVTINQLMQYLTPEFVNNVASMSADDLVKRYGTHVLLDISLGGRLRFNYSGSIITESDYTKKTSDVKAGLGFSLAKIIGVNINADKSTEEVTQITTETRNKQYTAKYYGGTNSGSSVSIDKDGNSSETINLASWQQSVNATNAALIGVGKALFIYDFIADPAKKAQVKTAVEKHIKDSQITIINDPVDAIWYPNTTMLSRGETILSKNGQYALVLAGGDGNLVLIKRATGEALWATNKYGPDGGTKVIMAADGNMLVFSYNRMVWAANFYWQGMDLTGSKSIYYILQDDGNFILMNSGKAVATTETYGGRKSTHFGSLKKM